CLHGGIAPVGVAAGAREGHGPRPGLDHAAAAYDEVGEPESPLAPNPGVAVDMGQCDRPAEGPGQIILVEDRPQSTDAGAAVELEFLSDRRPRGGGEIEHCPGLDRRPVLPDGPRAAQSRRVEEANGARGHERIAGVRVGAREIELAITILLEAPGPTDDRLE